LGIVIGNLDVLRGRIAAEPETDELAREALEAALRGAELNRRLLAFARRQPLQPTRLDLNALVEGIVTLLRRVLGEQIEITLDLGRDTWPAVVDQAQLEAAITNLATNARDAMPKGGRLAIATRNRRLDADYAAQHAEVAAGEYAEIEVGDNGMGMPPEVMSRIFEPFYTTKEQGRGTGLGLSMVFGFIKQSGGHISVYSEPGRGTTFRLYLPRASAGPDAAAAIGPAAAAPGGGERVLVVEDNAGLRRVAIRQLKELGYAVIEADSAAAAMAALEGGGADLVFSDIVMPGGVDGFDLAAEIGRRWPAIRVLLTSGFGGGNLEQSLAALPPGVRLLGKPYRKAELAAALRSVLETPAAGGNR
jgi:CheY-like chemotaxis protein